MSAQLIVKNCLKVLLISGIAWLPSCKDKTPDPVLIIRDTDVQVNMALEEIPGGATTSSSSAIGTLTTSNY